MTSLIAILDRARSSVCQPSPAQRDILERLVHLEARLAEGALRVAVLGQFKRGKSTLLNALLGSPLLPMGVTPVTAIPTFIRSGNRTKLRITFSGGRESVVSEDAAEIPYILERYVSETRNPENRLAVDTIDLEARSKFLDHGIVLVDTPGVGSTFVHNTATAKALLTECDAAVLVLSADPPITEVEATYLLQVKTVIPKLFFALNKIDLLDDDEKGVAERFLADVLKDRGVEEPVRIFLFRRDGACKQNRSAIAGPSMRAASEIWKEFWPTSSPVKNDILSTMGKRRALAPVGELLFQSRLEHKALLTPQQDLKQKIVIFESSVARFESEREDLTDFLSVDRKRVLSELDSETDRLWKDTRAAIQPPLGRLVTEPFDVEDVRGRTATALAGYFEQVLRSMVEGRSPSSTPWS